MDSKDLTLKSSRNIDAEFCGKLPLHQTNLVQPHGVFLIVHKDNFTILQVSENVDQVLSIPAAEAVQTSLSNYLPKPQFKELQQLFQEEVKEKIPFTFNIGGKNFLALIQSKTNFLLLEIEEMINEGLESSFAQVYQSIKLAMASVEAAATTHAACEQAAKELKSCLALIK